MATEFAQQRTEVAAEIRRLAPNIGKDTEEVLADMYTAKQLHGTTSDELIGLDNSVRISIAQGAQLNQLLRQSETGKSLEVGLAYGFSTVWILDGLRSHVNSRHIAIDPFQITLWGGVGLVQVKRLSNTPDFEWIGEKSIHALSRLIKSEERFDLIFIDGNHRFDDVLVDFYLSDQLVSPGGILAFDDMWLPSVQTVISFILTNRQYKIVPQPVRNMMVLKKIADDKRDWSHFEKFRVRGRHYARLTGTDRLLRQIRSKYAGILGLTGRMMMMAVVGGKAGTEGWAAFERTLLCPLLG